MLLSNCFKCNSPGRDLQASPLKCLVAYVEAERTRSGVITAKARGRAGGRPAKLIGERAGHARNLVATGSLVLSVARSMGISRASVHRALERAGTGVE